ncbi:MAG TPA: hypothetical protein VG870_14115 [Chitinophagaceae bacterium]|nr:hypothetical protein [Chitinophagaceae bacterium]
MKKTVLLSLTASLFILACHKKTVPEKTAVQQPAPQVSQQAPVAQQSTTTQPAATDASLAELGKTVLSTKCTKCHGLKNPGDFTAQRWDGILKSMIPKAKLTDDEAKQVTAYVLANAKP